MIKSTNKHYNRMLDVNERSRVDAENLYKFLLVIFFEGLL